LLCPSAHVAMPDTQSKYVLPFSSVNVDPDPETNVIGYLKMRVSQFMKMKEK